MLKGVKGTRLVNCKAYVETDNDEVIVVEFTTKYRVLKKSEIRDTMRKRDAGELTEDDILRRDVIGWEGMPSANADEDFKFSKEHLEEAIENLYYGNALVKGWRIAQLGKDAVLEKN